MTKAKLFKNGNSQAVRIPAELAYSSWDVDLVIERYGDELRKIYDWSYSYVEVSRDLEVF